MGALHPMPQVRYAFRALTRRPAFALVAVLTLALGIGANAAIFSVVDTVLLRPLPYADPGTLVMPWEFSDEVQQRLGFDRLPSSAADFVDYLTRNTTLQSFASVRTEQVNLTGEGEPERIGAARVSAQFFDVLGVRPVTGRSFAAGDEKGERVIMIAEALWERRFASDPGIAGRVISLNGEPATILGVLPRWFRFPAEGELPEAFGFTATPAVWTLDVLTPAQRLNRGGKSLALLGRLKPGVTASVANQDLGRIAADIARRSPNSNAGWGVRVMSLREQLVGSLRPALIALLAAVGFLLLISCANVTNLLLVRAAARQREVCLRFALGAARTDLILQCLTESLLIALAAGIAGLGLAWWMLHVLLAMAPTSLPALARAAIDWRVVGFTMLLSVGTGLLFGAVPAWHWTRSDASEGLREGARGTIGGRKASRTRNLLVISEVAMAVLLLIGSVLLIHAFIRLTTARTGFRSDRILTLEIALPKSAYPGARAAAFFEALRTRVSALPGVEAAAAASGLPLTGRESLSLVTIEGRPRPTPGQEIISDYRVVTSGYFQVLGIPLLEGSDVSPLASAETPPLAVISATMARVCWPGEAAIGRRFKLASYDQSATWYAVAGIVGDTRHTSLNSGLRPQVYVHHSQDPSQQMAMVLRTVGDPIRLAAPARAAVLALDPNQPVARVRTMTDVLETSVAGRRFHMFLVSVFALLAVMLSVVGLYAVVSYSVAERIHELGIRVALGANPSHLLRLVLGDGLRLVGTGIAVGLTAALVSTRFLQALFYGVDVRDPPTFILAPLMLLVAGLLGCLGPALRAMRVDPVTALRGE
jgi:putative ABC transport system permease protein